MGKERKKKSIAGSGELKFPWDKQFKPKERKSQSSDDATSTTSSDLVNTQKDHLQSHLVHNHSSPVDSHSNVESIQTCLSNNSINPLMNCQTCSQECQEKTIGHAQAMITGQPERSLQQELDFVLLLLKIQFAIIQSYQESQ